MHSAEQGAWYTAGAQKCILHICMGVHMWIFFLKINLAIKQLKIHTVLSFLGKNKVYVLCLL